MLKEILISISNLLNEEYDFQRGEFMNKFLISMILVFVFCVASVSYYVYGLKNDYKVDICNTPIYKLSVSQLNEAVKTCKKWGNDVWNKWSKYNERFFCSEKF